jgi:alkylation response protein AidB-like acyl-CoA dehydrogenase
VLGKPGQALNLEREEMLRAWIRIAARYLGCVERLLDMGVVYAVDWVALGRPLVDRPAVRRMLADIQVQIEGCRWLVLHAAWLGDQKKPLTIPSAQARLATGELLQKATDFVTMVFGGPGPSSETEAYRFINSMLAQAVMNMTLESASTVIANHILASYQRN